MDILIIEDNAIVVSKLSAIIEGRPGWKVAAAVDSAEEAVEYLQSVRVDLAILDLGLPGLSDGAAVQAIRRVAPDLKILVFSGSIEEEKILDSLKAGAIGYLMKTATAEEITRAIEEIDAGGSALSPAVAVKVLQDYQRQFCGNGGNHRGKQGGGNGSPLSNRESQILALLYRGDDLHQIADHLCISPHTVRVHTKKIYAKLNANSRSHAIYEALQRDLIKP